MSRKLFFKWLRSYRIYNAKKNKDIYILEKLNKLPLASTFLRNRLKKFYLYQKFALIRYKI